ncbi:hypothetical protein JNB63_05295 [Microbacterium trichothecenolyticum]|uniref:Fibrinogen-binding protein n=1 Tax=Microbacterium ureisolvens TaxID=2781186 RepID=A0ABS7I4M7_9MICO|nr:MULTISPECIES: hypothetical protein [Microbacterium]MBW9111994.1 hypothetical protein [Microbacterium ureisolvens]MBW9119503.1 hypothetical protein [Microbacterium trichothecenolyticum]
MADENVNVLGVQTNIEDVLSNNEVGNTDVEVEDNNVNSAVDNDDNNINSAVGNEIGNTDVDVEDSGNGNFSGNLSGNTDNSDNSDNSVETDLEVEIEDSFNDNSDNSNDDNSETEDSYNDNSETEDSYNDYTDSFNETTLNDDSVTVGVRQYNTGVGGDLNLALGGAGGAAAAAAAASGALNLDIDNRAQVVDQSVSQSFGFVNGDVDQEFEQEAVANSGDWGAAAGDDADVDNSQTTISVGDVSIGNTWIDTHIQDSFQDNSTNEWNEFEVEIDDSFNDQSTDVDVDIEDSFTSEVDNSVENELEWENSGNFFSPGGDVAGDDIVDF